MLYYITLQINEQRQKFQEFLREQKELAMKREDDLLKSKLAVLDKVLQDELNAIEFQNQLVVEEKKEVSWGLWRIFFM